MHRMWTHHKENEFTAESLKKDNANKEAETKGLQLNQVLIL